MSHTAPIVAPPSVDIRSHDLFKACLVQYGQSPLFGHRDEWASDDNPYRRPLRPHVFQYLDFSRPLRRDQVLTYASLAANRVLLTVYERDFVFLPRRGFADKRGDFEEFYSDRLAGLGEIIRPHLEHFLFDFLDQEISITGRWTTGALENLFTDFVRSLETAGPSRTTETIRQSENATHAARMLLIQLCGDFLVEASPMARNILGNYGPLQSELFKIVVDEYGYGVHSTKHSTLFERVLEYAGLQPEPHTYWQFYLPSALLLNNYFNMVCCDHSKFFRYLGAILHAETAFIHYCRDVAETLRTVFGPETEVQYFLEHTHIDRHHSRMVYRKLIEPALAVYGDEIVPDIVRGFEESRLLSEIAEQDFCEQVVWSDNGGRYKALGPAVFAKIASGAITPRRQRFIEPRGEVSITHVHDGDELCVIESGVMHFTTGYQRYTELNASEGTVILRNRLHGAIIASQQCVYDIYSIGDYQKCLS